MASLRNEIRILLTGPENRFFIAYKPQGWFLTTPFDGRRNEGVLAPVLAAKLGVSASAITFPSKLTVQERGLVIGCTDASMHQTLSRILRSGLCTKTYQCIIHANSATNSQAVGRSAFKHAYRCFDHRTDVSSGVVRFDLLVHEKAKSLKKLSAISSKELRSALSQFIARGRSISASNVRVHKGAMPYSNIYDATNGSEECAYSHDDTNGPNAVGLHATNDHPEFPSSNSCLQSESVSTFKSPHNDGGSNQHSIAFIMENLCSYMQRFAGHNGISDTMQSHIGVQTQRQETKYARNIARFRHMELVTSSHDVNRHLVEILSSLGLVILTGNTKAGSTSVTTTEGSMCLELCGLQFPHPIYKHRVVEALAYEDDPEVPNEWIQHAITASF